MNNLGMNEQRENDATVPDDELGGPCSGGAPLRFDDTIGNSAKTGLLERCVFICLEALGIIALILGLSLSGNLYAQGDHTLEDDIGGLLIDRTLTRTGRDFFKAFSDNWREHNINQKYNLVVIERPSARQGSRIQIQYNDRDTYNTVLSPGRSDARHHARQAATFIADRVSMWELQSQLDNAPELAPDEF